MSNLTDQLQHGLKSHQAGDLEAAGSTYREILRIDRAHPEALHLLGVVELQSGRHEQAAELISQAVELNPRNHIYHSNLGTSYRGLRKHDQAVSAFRQAIEINPDYGQGWYNLGHAHESCKEWEQAEHCYRECLNRLPEFHQAWNNLGNVLLKLERLTEAEEAFQKLVELQPASAEGFYNLGNTQFAIGNYSEALKSYDHARELNPELPGLNLSYGQLAHNQGDLPRAIKFYEAELERSPQSTKSLINLGCAMQDVGDIQGAMHKFQQSAVGMANSCLQVAQSLMADQQYEEAAAQFDTAIELLPDHLDCYLGGATCYDKAGNRDRAVAIARQAVERFSMAPESHNLLGLMLHQMGNNEEALLHLQRAMDLNPEYPEAQYHLGSVLVALGRGDEAVGCFQNSLRIAPHYVGAWNNLGGIHCQQGNAEAAIECFQKAIAVEPNLFEAHSNLGNVLQGQGKFAEAVECYLRAISINPRYPQAYRNLAQAYVNLQRLEDAERAYLEAVRLKPDYFEAWNNLGIVYVKLKNWLEAERCYREALQLNPTYKEARSNLAFLLHMRGEFDSAIDDLHKLLKENEDAITWNNLAIAYAHKDRIDDALAAYRKSAEQDVNYADPHNNMGILYANMGRMTEAMQEYEKALRLRPDFPEAFNNLGTAHQVQGTIEESVAAYRESLRLRPDYSEARSNLLFVLNYDAKISPEDLTLEYKAWDRMYGRNDLPFPPHQNDPDPDRKLRVGYVSPDFRLHSVAYYIEPIIAHHNPELFEVHGYAQVPNPDSVTARIRSRTAGWRNICGVNDEQLAEMIREDKIDILVDLTGHTGRNRLPTFALKPAPVQVTYLGYPNTTGLTRMDYRLTDDLADPLHQSAWHSEELFRLPHGFLCYQPGQNAPSISLPPSLSKGYITFGSFNSQSKVHNDVIRLWSQVMQQVPGSKMYLKSRPLADAGIRNRIWREFESHGIERLRVDLSGQIAATDQHLNMYNQIDIALDTFPYNGTTTTCESLWMGVPVVTLKGNTHASRVGVSLLTRIGLPELIGETPADYIRIARDLSQDRRKLLDLRWTSRQRMINSDLCNKQLITTDIETAYRSMWRRWCESQASSSHS